MNNEKIRSQFPVLASGVMYLDNAATVQKPQSVLDAMNDFYVTSNANINRGVHALGEKATIAYDDARKATAKFVNAKRTHEIIFTRNATEAINLVARSYGETLTKKDRIVLTILEHHSNIVPWQQLSERNGAQITWIDCDNEGSLRTDELDEALSKGDVKIVTVTAVSNVTGVRTPIEEIIKKAHDAGAVVLIDASQMAPHERIDVQELDADFLVFSAHKMYGPTGIGVLYAKEKLLEEMPPFLGGGDMIQTVTRYGFKPAELPRKFEAGTPAIAEAVGLHAAIEWIGKIGFENIMAHEKSLLARTIERLSDESTSRRVTLLGPNDVNKIASCISFVVDGIHAHDVTQILSDKGVMMRAGHHCTQPLHERLGITASSRLSVAVYNTKKEIDIACAAIKEILATWK